MSKFDPADETADPAPDDYRLDAQVGFVLRRVQQRHTAIFMGAMPHDLTPTQFAALVRLGEVDACSQNELGRRTAMDVATIKGVIDRLRARGFVAAMPDPLDLRRSALALTEKGRSVLDTAITAGRAITERTLEPLTQRERETLLRLLVKIAE